MWVWMHDWWGRKETENKASIDPLFMRNTVAEEGYDRGMWQVRIRSWALPMDLKAKKEWARGSVDCKFIIFRWEKSQASCVKVYRMKLEWLKPLSKLKNNCKWEIEEWNWKMIVVHRNNRNGCRRHILYLNIYSPTLPSFLLLSFFFLSLSVTRDPLNSIELYLSLLSWNPFLSLSFYLFYSFRRLFSSITFHLYSINFL